MQPKRRDAQLVTGRSQDLPTAVLVFFRVREEFCRRSCKWPCLPEPLDKIQLA